MKTFDVTVHTRTKWSCVVAAETEEEAEVKASKMALFLHGKREILEEGDRKLLLHEVDFVEAPPRVMSEYPSHKK